MSIPIVGLYHNRFASSFVSQQNVPQPSQPIAQPVAFGGAKLAAALAAVVLPFAVAGSNPVQAQPVQAPPCGSIMPTPTPTPEFVLEEQFGSRTGLEWLEIITSKKREIPPGEDQDYEDARAALINAQGHDLIRRDGNGQDALTEEGLRALKNAGRSAQNQRACSD